MMFADVLRTELRMLAGHKLRVVPNTWYAVEYRSVHGYSWIQHISLDSKLSRCLAARHKLLYG